MKERDVVRTAVIRNIMAELTNQLVATKRTPQETLTDAEVTTVIKRLAKQRQDSIDQYRAADRTEQAAQESAELDVLQTYLPQLMSHDEIRPIVQAKQTELGITDPTKIGVLIGAVMKETAGRADGTDVKAVATSVLNDN